MEEFYIGQTFDDTYPPSAAKWCNENETCHIEMNSDGKYEIVENEDVETDLLLDDGSMPYLELQELAEETYLMTEYNTILLEQLMEG